MKTSDYAYCKDFACSDVNKDGYILPSGEISPEKVKIIMVSEAPPTDAKDYFYSPNGPFYLRTTLQAFHDAGIQVNTMKDILELGVYITTAIKCAKMQYSVSTETIRQCSYILESELELFPNAKVFLLMGDVAIKAMNYIAQRQTRAKVVPSGSTYKIRKQQFYFKDKRVFPSYLQTGGNYLIEKSKRRMIAEDIKNAFEILDLS